MANPVRIGFVFGLFLALFHTCWAALVALGWAQKLIDFIFWIHFIAPPYHIEAFDIARACILVAVTFIVGFVIGTLGGVLWNALHRA
ncbi:MAG TPA: hypothetical protein VKT24_02250 [Rhizomicrobium sp.]|nr:hypothetical protein [Rhizomicrobium sp.]